MAEQKQAEQKKASTQEKEVAAEMPNSVPEEFQERAKDYPEGDAVLKAYKDGLTADKPSEEAKAYAKAAEESPRAVDTPSGGALIKVAGIGDDAERAEKYAKEKASRRWGYVPPGA